MQSPNLKSVLEMDFSTKYYLINKPIKWTVFVGKFTTRLLIKWLLNTTVLALLILFKVSLKN